MMMMVTVMAVALHLYKNIMASPRRCQLWLRL